jgi:hypothetical protein
MNRAFWLFLVALLAVLALTTPAAAADSSMALYGGFWQSFIEYWQQLFQKQNGVVLGVLGVGAVALFIITRGKWNK